MSLKAWMLPFGRSVLSFPFDTRLTWCRSWSRWKKKAKGRCGEDSCTIRRELPFFVLVTYKQMATEDRSTVGENDLKRDWGRFIGFDWQCFFVNKKKKSLVKWIPQRVKRQARPPCRRSYLTTADRRLFFSFFFFVTFFLTDCSLLLSLSPSRWPYPCCDERTLAPSATSSPPSSTPMSPLCIPLLASLIQQLRVSQPSRESIVPAPLFPPFLAPPPCSRTCRLGKAITARSPLPLHLPP